ncbi:sensor histidine kinase [Gorillibacterium massiliense]|uniref:sensor histidine kinase n=1 Tax=Gorillibacterium massiliense TaxID=1280390 RepID=UPI0004AFABCF|nr:ATP-binding protein [Gorillibacterium massiliense]
MEKAVLTEDDRLSAIHFLMDESRRLQTVSHQLLELAQLRNDRIALEAQSVPRLFQAVRQTLHNKIADTGIQIDFLCETDELWGDAALLQSLFVNLIDNALKACAAKGKNGRIFVRAARDDGKISVSIRDNGKGMPPEVLRHITEPFYRGEKSRNRKDGGAGLGLAICKQIVELHRAELIFTSSPEEGTLAEVNFTTLS